MKLSLGIVRTRSIALLFGVIAVLMTASGCWVTGPPVTASILKDAEERRPGIPAHANTHRDATSAYIDSGAHRDAA